MQNIDEHRRTNTGNEISVYDVVVDSGIHNDGIYDETRPSSGHNNNGRLSGKVGSRGRRVVCDQTLIVDL